VCEKEHQAGQVREELLAHLKGEQIEPPARDRVRRILGTALRQAEQALTARIASRIPVALLRLYLARAGYTSGPLFRASINGQGGPLSYDAAHSRWKKYCAAAGAGIGIHQLRHAHATELINGGVSIEVVRRRLGHASTETTQVYTLLADKVADAEIRAARRRRAGQRADRPCVLQCFPLGLRNGRYKVASATRPASISPRSAPNFIRVAGMLFMATTPRISWRTTASGAPESAGAGLRGRYSTRGQAIRVSAY
jgi:hypothetical protein